MKQKLNKILWWIQFIFRIYFQAVSCKYLDFLFIFMEEIKHSGDTNAVILLEYPCLIRVEHKYDGILLYPSFLG